MALSFCQPVKSFQGWYLRPHGEIKCYFSKDVHKCYGRHLLWGSNTLIMYDRMVSVAFENSWPWIFLASGAQVPGVILES